MKAPRPYLLPRQKPGIKRRALDYVLDWGPWAVGCALFWGLVIYMVI